MIILIGGVGNAGKTCLAQKLLEKYKYPYLSIDHLKMGLYRADKNCGFTPLDSVELIGGKLWPIIKGIIMTAAENGQNLIIEGGYLLPRRISGLDADYLERVVSFYLGFSEAYIEKNYESAILENMRAMEPKDRDDAETKDEFLAENRAQRELCARFGAKYFEMDGEYGAEIEKVCAWLDGELRKRGQKLQ